MKLNEAFELALILAWEDLKKVSEPCSARLEYCAAPATAVDYLSIWSVDAEGHQKMVCDYWTWSSPLHASGISFKDQFRSAQLGDALDFILMNQEQFTRPNDACAEALALIHPPTEAEHAEAVTWISGAHGAAVNVSRAEKGNVAAA